MEHMSRQIGDIGSGLRILTRSYVRFDLLSYVEQFGDVRAGRACRAPLPGVWNCHLTAMRHGDYPRAPNEGDQANIAPTLGAPLASASSKCSKCTS